MTKPGLLIIQSLGLGDLVFSLPVIRVLKRCYPHHNLHFLTHEKNAGLLDLVPELTSVISYSNQSPLTVFLLIRRLRSLKLEKVFVLNPIFKGSLLAWLSGARQRIGYRTDFERTQSLHGLNFLLSESFDPENRPKHEVDRYLDLLKDHGLKIEEGDLNPKLEINRSAPPKSSSKRVLINLGAAWENRKWPLERLARLALWIHQAYSADIVFCGSKQESQAADSIISQLESGSKNLCGKTTLAQLAALIKESDLFITNDTGPLHIAAALDCTTLAFFGPGDLAKVKPRSTKTHLLRHPFPCSPCRFQYTDRCENNLCMQDITFDEAVLKVQELLGPGSIDPSSIALKTLTLPERKRVLYLQSTSEVGGTDVTLLRTLGALDRTKFEAHVLLPKEGPFTNAYRGLGCKVHILESMKKLTRRRGVRYLIRFLAGYFPAVLKIAALIRRQRIDLVHTNTIHNWYGFFAALISKRPHLWHIREIVVQSSFVRAVELFLVRYFSTRFIVMDNAIAEMFLTHNHGFPRNSVKLYDGIDLTQFHPLKNGTRIRKELGIPAKAPLIGTVSRLDPWKGIDGFLDAAQFIRRQIPDAHFLVCGGAIEGHEEYERQLREKILKMGLSDVLHLSGWKYYGADIPEVYAALTISVQMPIFPEPYGLANIEAMASGVPTVCYDEGGPSEICLSGQTGFLVPPKNPQAIADAVVTLLKDSTAAERFALQGRARVEALFDVQKCTRNLEGVYADILGVIKEQIT